MAQAPVSPKLKRAALRAATAIVGPGIARNGVALLPSERAALDLRQARQSSPWRPAQEVIFLIPLVGPDNVGDWQQVNTRLQSTLEALLAQTDTRWRAVICCQKQPVVANDPRILFLPFDDPTTGNDKWRKLACLTAHLDTLSQTPAYVMSFDADDLLHKDSVANMLSAQSRGGYLATTGFVMDHATRGVALAGPPTLSKPLRKPFWKLCGSCAALHHDPALPPSSAFLQEMTQHEHRMFPYLAALAGLTLTPMVIPSVLYILNHGENFGARRGRVSFKTRFVERFRVTDPQQLASLDTDFPTV